MSPPREGTNVARLGVVLVDSPTVVLAALGMLVRGQPDVEVVVEAGSADECMSRLDEVKHRRGVVVVVGLDLRGPHDAFWLIRAIRDRFPALPIVASGVHCNDETISRALFVGADSYVDKDIEPRSFYDAIRRTGQGEVVLEGVPATWLAKIVERLDEPRVKPVLTSRELEVLEVATEGLTARQIGRRLGVRERTVTTHLGRIYKKLGTQGRVAAIAQATRTGLMPTRAETSR